MVTGRCCGKEIEKSIRSITVANRQQESSCRGAEKMKRKLNVLVFVAVILPIGVTSCATSEQSMGAGAIAGALLGAAFTGNSARGAALGAAIGAAAGFAVHNAKAKQVKSAEETRTEYDYNNRNGFQIQMNKGAVSPHRTDPDAELVVRMEYVILGSGDGKPVRESRILKRDGKVLKELQNESVVRKDGTWENTLGFKVPATAPSGRYTVLQRVEAGGLVVSEENHFRVLGDSAVIEHDTFNIAVVAH